jgi:hypothetical protein
MTILRNVLGVVVGYLIFAIGAVMLFHLAGIDRHATPGLGTAAAVIVAGAGFAFAGGFAAKRIVATGTLKANVVLVCIMAGFAAVSLFISAGDHYTQLAAIFLFAPSSLLGGSLARR